MRDTRLTHRRNRENSREGSGTRHQHAQLPRGAKAGTTADRLEINARLANLAEYPRHERYGASLPPLDCAGKALGLNTEVGRPHT